jgi:integrase
MAKWNKSKTGAWQKQIWHGGRPITLTFRGSLADANQYEAQRRIELGAVEAPTTTGSALAFEPFCVDHFKPYAKAKWRKSTYGVRKFYLEHLILHFGKVKLTKITEVLIEAYRQKRLAEGIAKSTINSELGVLSAALTFARTVLKTPCSKPKIPIYKVQQKKERVKFWTEEEGAHILATTKKEAAWFYALFLFLFETGVRKSEAVSLSWKRVDFVRKVAHIWNDGETQYEVKSREREVPLSDFMIVVLKALKLKNGASAWVFPCVTSRGEGTKGERLVEFPDNAWTRIVKRAGLEGSPHKARHTYASLFLSRCPDLFLLGRLLGHSHSRVTELYSHLLPAHLATARGIVTFGPDVAKTHFTPTLPGSETAGAGQIPQ